MTQQIERPGAVTFRGSPLTLVGPDLQEGDRAPDFQVVNTDLQPVRLSQFAGRPVLLSVSLSLDTPVCDIQGKRFNELASQVSSDVVMANVTVDLPFALRRWCGATGADRIQLWSDYREHDFGLKFGVLIKELQLLARSVWIIDGDGIIRYKEVVPEVTQEPNYEAALNALRRVVGS